MSNTARNSFIIEQRLQNLWCHSDGGGFLANVVHHLLQRSRRQMVMTLEEVCGAITYYLANRDTVDRYLAQQAELWTELRRTSEQTTSPVVTRLRAMRQAEVGDPA
ncbi:MAG: hypothetical protein ACKV2Q_21145 [Planctomycetaceae bacterium]